MIFSEMLMQRPLGRKTFHLPSGMTSAERGYMRTMAQKHFDAIMGVLRQMPKDMLLVFRLVRVSAARGPSRRDSC